MTNPGAGMPCPVCKVPLVMSDRQGVEIDYCPQCRGVWLDRGELDNVAKCAKGGCSARSLCAAHGPVSTGHTPRPRTGLLTRAAVKASLRGGEGARQRPTSRNAPADGS